MKNIWPAINFFSLFYISVASVIDVFPKSTTVKEGENVIFFNCTQSANHRNRTSLNFTWTKFGKDSVLSNSSLLPLVNITRAASGSYVCTATNGTANWSAVAVANITVLCKCTFVRCVVFVLVVA